jgi:hypothetical protein
MGRWHVDGKRVKRKLGPVRPAGTREGLTRAQAERELRRTMSAHEVLPAVAERVTVTQAGERLIRHPEGLGRRPTTLAAYRAALRSHLTPALGELPLGKVAPRDVEGFIAASAGAVCRPRRPSTRTGSCTRSPS